MNRVAAGVGVAAAIGLATTAAVLVARRQSDPPPQTINGLAETLVHNFDSSSRTGNHDGAVDIAAEGVRYVFHGTVTSRERTPAPTSSFSELPIGSAGHREVTTTLDRKWDGTALWAAVDSHGDSNGSVTVDELSAWLGTAYDTDDQQGLLDGDELERLARDYRSAFQGKLSVRWN